ncbi:MAG: F0F1 ATP synthase subunit B [Clostridium sp.]|nr:F0F1 ATP synthase subunit B [Bacteroides sp.]MCM1198920.1 F0F1 ATP synthase subunit B [Clostridium sp.]
MSLLMPDSGLLFWMIVIFAIVFGLLAKFGFPMITGMVEKRTERIGESLRLAREADEKIGTLAKEQERMIAEARKEQDRILKEAAQARENIILQAKAQASDEAEKIIADARIRIEAEKESAIRDIRGQVALLSVKVAEKIIRKELSSDSEQLALVDRMLEEASRADMERRN